MGPQVAYWLFSVSLLTLPLLVYVRLTRQRPDDRWGRIGTWAAERVHDLGETADVDDDDWLAADLAAVLGRERLLGNLRRVQHLVATDEWMSAVRQIGNRMAYEQLLHDVRCLPEADPLQPPAGAFADWGGSPVQRTNPSAGAYVSAGGGTVETLDFGLRR